MALFQKTIIRKYQNQLDQGKVTEAWNKFQAHFHNASIQENIRNSKEEQYQAGFLVDLFVKVLGYTINPSEGYNLSTEYKNEKDSKKADGALIFGDKVVAAIELKGTNTTDLGKIEAQAFGYKNNQKDCDYVITSNFEKLRFYVDNAIDHLEFNLFKLTRDEFELLYLCLHKNQIRNGIPKKIKDESIVQEEDVTKKLYKDYSLFKRVLFTNLCELNPDRDQLEIFKKTQKLLDRFLFVFFAEDRGLIPPYSVRRIVREWDTLKELDVYIPLLDRFRQFFGYFNSGYRGKDFEIFAYNGGLFAPDEFLDAIQIADDLLYEHTVKLADYNFASEVDVNILGHIFENSLNEIDEIKAQIAGEVVEKTKTKRKKDGVFYTPKYITKYIVDNTVGKLCDEQKAVLGIVEDEYITDKKRTKPTIKKLADKLTDYREWLLQLTICDPACGSGAFLNQALEFLIAEHRYIDELQAKLFGDAMVLTDIENSILENNLFGVDLNEESVEIAKLSLWLRTAQPNRKLNNLNNNIKCGNSLIDDPAVAGDKAFNWEQEFPTVFAKGGFDVIIGNPPYVNSKGNNFSDKHKEYYYNKYQTSIYQIDTYILFFEKLSVLIKGSGLASYIIPNSWMNNLFLKGVRGFILKNYFLNEIVNTPNGIFTDATVDTVIVILSKFKNIGSELIKISNIINNEIVFKQYKPQTTFIENTDHIIDIFSDRKTSDLLLQIEHNNIKLGSIAKIGRGVGIYHKRVGHTKELIASDPFQATYKKDETFIPFLKGRNIGLYSFDWNENQFLSYGPWIAEPRDKNFFEGERLVLRQIPGKDRLYATIIIEQFVIDQSVFIAKLKEGISTYSIRYIMAIVGSKMLNFYFRNKYSEFDELFPKVKLQHFKDFPIKIISPEAQQPFIEKADLMLQLNKDLQTISSKFLSLVQSEFGLQEISKAMQKWYELSFADFTKELKKKKIELSLAQKSEWMDFFETEKKKALELQQQINQTDKEIDRMVYELYELTEEEIKIVEGE